ncbi:glycoside hydrolase family protein [Pantoea ananatis]|uniref:glycoside hydrolase family protein n=1 Tax=Pantoea ananas TaxID=553 RepID=UPI00207AF0EC|nr:glycoside hydrolase family protein [Pantoea ananatis]USL56751.1 glycoside hydrolase family protein [Pantoea ananatis]
MDIKSQLKIYEGTKEYQAKLGYFREGKFYPYKDSLGYLTIGYGKLIQGKESKYKDGITEQQADMFLDEDIATARNDVKKLQVNLPDDSKWNEFLVLMLFQLGLTKTLQFRKFLSALKTGNYSTAIKEVKDSNWYRQTPNRVDQMIEVVLRG